MAAQGLTGSDRVQHDPLRPIHVDNFLGFKNN